MVRKRTHKDETESDDSDSDYDPASNDSEPKRYSLRKRTRQALIEDFDYEVDSELSSRHPSDDEEYTLEEDINSGTPYVSCVQPAINDLQRLPETPQTDNGLIDFEDVIRADIVINKNKIDLNTGLDRVDSKVVKRRGRPPKYKPQIEDFGHSILGPLADVFAPIEDAAHLVETHVEEHEPDSHNPSFDSHNPSFDPGVESVHGCVEDVNLAKAVPESSVNSEDKLQLAESTTENQIHQSCNKDQETSSVDVQKPIENGSTSESDKVLNIIAGNGENKLLTESNSPKSEAPEQKIETVTKEVSGYVEDDDDDVILVQNSTEVVVLDD